MNKLYCQNCGSGTPYSLEKPNFCAKCGIPFSMTKQEVLSAKGKVGTVGPRGIRKGSEEESETETNEYGDDVMHVPSIDELEIDIDLPQVNKGIRLEHLMAAGPSQGAVDETFPKDARTEEEMLNDLKKEGGTLRESS